MEYVLSAIVHGKKMVLATKGTKGDANNCNKKTDFLKNIKYFISFFLVIQHIHSHTFSAIILLITAASIIHNQ